ncbi:MAG TPA: response regulator [Pirellulales bacterium]|nr:response regulator [Pirellulales bacterium]
MAEPKEDAMWDRQLNVLVVDDDAGDVELLRRQLALVDQCAAEVVQHADPDSVATRIERDKPDAVFVDFYLGAKCGLDVVKSLRESGHLLPVIMLTGQGSISIVKESFTSGADDYLDKNMLDPGALWRSLQRAHLQCVHRQAEVKLRLIQFSIDHASDPMMWVSDSGRFSYVNEAACQLLSYTKDEFLALSVPDISTTVHRENWQGAWDLLKQNGAMTREDQWRARDGSTIPVELRLNYVRWKRIERTCAFVRDLRERKKAEAELREKADQLRHKQRLEAVGSLAGGVAHEFNNLLQAICGFTHYAMDGLPVEDPRRSDLEQVLGAADRAASLTRQLLGFSRKQVLERAVFEANDVVSDLVRMLRPIIGEHIEVKSSLALDAGCLFADRNLLVQMLLNLCINARDAMPDGGRLTMATQRVVLSEQDRVACGNLRPGVYVAMAISDSGCGMPPEVKERVFEPFFTTKGVGKGTGLGLAMVYGGVQQHGGAIVLDSEVDRGTRFTIYLPIAEHGDSTASNVPRSSITDGTETILIAEDESIVRDLTVRILTQAGYTVLAACDGDDAVQTFEAHADSISLVLLDAVMPKLTGHQVYERINLKTPEMPVIFCSGYDPETDQVKTLIEQGVRILQKPFDASSLLHIVREVLDARNASHELTHTV